MPIGLKEKQAIVSEVNETASRRSLLLWLITEGFLCPV